MSASLSFLVQLRNRHIRGGSRRLRAPSFLPVFIALCITSLLLAGCQASGGAGGQPFDSQGGSVAASPTDSPPNPPAVTEGKIVPGDTASWPLATRSAQGTSFSFRYPAGWKPDLSYCAPGAAQASGQSFRVPAGCAVTDILAGQKAAGLGRLTGDSLTLDGKRAIRQVDTQPRSGLAARIYTVMLYDASGAPLFGFSTSIGPGTDQATQDAITTTLDEIASTLHEEQQP